MFKKGLLLLLSLFIIALVIGCGSDDQATKVTGNEGDTEAEEDTETEEDSSASAEIEEIELTLAHNSPEGDSVHIGATKFKEAIEKKSDGKITVEIFPNAQLGGEIENIESMGAGTIDMVIPGDGAFSSFSPKYLGVTMPFIFEDIDHMTRVFEGEIGEEINQAFIENVNSRIAAIWHRSARNMSTSKEIMSLEDLEGMDLRVPTNPLFVEAFSRLGANPTPIPFDELYVALQQGVVQGQENPVDLIYSANLYEVQDYLTLTQHVYSPWIPLINNDVYEGFSEATREVFQEAMEEATQHQRQFVADSESEFIQKLEDEGMTVNEIDIEPFKEKLFDSGIIEDMSDDWVPNLIERIKES